MSDISLSKAVRSNLLSLQNTADMMAKTQSRLATGNKVNSALDNPTNFFTAQGLNSRASDLNALMDSMANGIQTLEAADNGLTSITKTLESMQSTLRQARQDKSFQTESFTLSTLDPASAGQLSLSGGAFGGTTNVRLTTTGEGKYIKTSSAYTEPAALAASTLTGGTDLTSGARSGGAFTIDYGGKRVELNLVARSAGDNLAAIETEIQTKLAGTALDGLINVDTSGGSIRLTAASQEDGQIELSGAAAEEIFGAGAPARTGTLGSDAKSQFTINGIAITLERDTTGDTLTTAINEINAQLEAAGSKFQAYDDGTSLGIRATTTDAGNLVIGGKDANLFGTPNAGGTVPGATSAGLTLVKTVDNLVREINNSADTKDKVKASNDNGKLRIQNLSTEELTIQGADADGRITGNTAVESTIAGNNVRADLASQFNELRDQLDKLSDDASFNGINLLRGDKLTITFNETGTSSIDIQTKDQQALDAARLQLLNIVPADLDADSAIDARLATVKDALAHVRSQASTFGSNLSIVENRQSFTKNMINTLETGAANLTLADMNEEAANLLALQTRQALSSNSLSLASQADQSVLQLLQ